MTAVSLTDVLRPTMDEGRAVAGLVVQGWEEAYAISIKQSTVEVITLLYGEKR